MTRVGMAAPTGRMGGFAVGCLLLSAAAQAAASEAQVSLRSLLDEMVDRAALARRPQPAYTCRQASSYDRAAKAPGEPGWFANNDRSFFVRAERHGDRDEWVLMDVEGPGAIVRWWVTAPAYLGVIRVYLDGASEPAIEARVDELVGGEALVGPPLSHVTARGRNLYLPIPYARRCKVTFDRPNFQQTKRREDMLYYQINYRTYQPGTAVRTFSRDQLDALADVVQRVQRTLMRPGAAAQQASDQRTALRRRLAPGERCELELQGPAAVSRLAVRLEADDPTQALRTTVLAITFDGEPAVWCPVGDFFGCGVGLNPYEDWRRTVKPDGLMVCRWIMPFARSCQVSLTNYGDQPVEAALGPVAVAPWRWDDRSLHFHANWRQEREIVTKPQGATARDWNYLTVKGQGVYAGDTLAVYNRVLGWWGEGDEKVYVDGEPFPSHFGTGTEDYYGYAWCTPEVFQTPFHAQPQAEGPRNAGHVTNSRLRLLDAIPFQRSLRFDMEVWHWADTLVDYAVTTYWYARPGAESQPRPDPNELVLPKTGPITAGGFRVLKTTRGVVQTQNMKPFGQGVWTNDDQLWWTGAGPGDELELALPETPASWCDVSVIFTKAPDYAVVDVGAAGGAPPKRVDLYHPKVIRSEPVRLGRVRLGKDGVRLRIKIVGANQAAVKRYLVGVDEVRLTPR